MPFADPFAGLPTLDALVDPSAIEVEVEGRRYRFAELDLAAMARLQEAVKALQPHPLQAIRPYLAGLPASAVDAAVTEATRQAASWPPRVGSNAATQILTGSSAGLTYTLHEGLKATRPGVTMDDAAHLLNALERDVKRRRAAGLPPEAVVTRIISVIFGNGDPETSRPKAGATATTPASPGTSSS